MGSSCTISSSSSVPSWLRACFVDQSSLVCMPANVENDAGVDMAREREERKDNRPNASTTMRGQCSAVRRDTLRDLRAFKRAAPLPKETSIPHPMLIVTPVEFIQNLNRFVLVVI